MSVAAIVDRNYHIFIAQPTNLACHVHIIEVMNLDLAKTKINNNNNNNSRSSNGNI